MGHLKDPPMPALFHKELPESIFLATRNFNDLLGGPRMPSDVISGCQKSHSTELASARDCPKVQIGTR